jgi:hypothetical protein
MKFPWRCCQYLRLCIVALNCRIIGKLGIGGKNVEERNSCGIIEILSKAFLGGTEKTPVRIVSQLRFGSQVTIVSPCNVWSESVTFFVWLIKGKNREESFTLFYSGVPFCTSCELLTTVTMKPANLCKHVPFSLVDFCQPFRGTYCQKVCPWIKRA